MEAQRGPDADRLPLDRRDERLLEPRERANEAPGRSRSTFLSGGLRAGEEIADVVAGGEDAAFSAEQQRADAFVATGRLESGEQRLVHLPGERVLLLRPVQGDANDAAVATGGNEIGHANSCKAAS